MPTSADQADAQALESAIRSAFTETTKPEVTASAEAAAQAGSNAASEAEAPRVENRQRPRQPLLSPPEPKETIYVGNIFYDVTAEDLKRQMEKYGTVEHARIIHDNRGLSKG